MVDKCRVKQISPSSSKDNLQGKDRNERENCGLKETQKHTFFFPIWQHLAILSKNAPWRQNQVRSPYLTEVRYFFREGKRFSLICGTQRNF
jgi:hypothetical protein